MDGRKTKTDGPSGTPTERSRNVAPWLAGGLEPYNGRFFSGEIYFSSLDISETRKECPASCAFHGPCLRPIHRGVARNQATVATRVQSLV
jgi:hypothetical protein